MDFQLPGSPCLCLCICLRLCLCRCRCLCLFVGQVLYHRDHWLVNWLSRQLDQVTIYYLQTPLSYCQWFANLTTLLLLHYCSTVYPTTSTFLPYPTYHPPVNSKLLSIIFTTPFKVVVNYLSSEWPFSSQLIQITISHLKTPSMKRNSPRLSLFNHHSNHLCFKSSQFWDLVFSLPIYTAETTAAANKIDLKTWRFSLRATVFMLWERWTNFNISNNYFFCKFRWRYIMLLICVHIIRHM